MELFSGTRCMFGNLSGIWLLCKIYLSLCMLEGYCSILSQGCGWGCDCEMTRSGVDI